jgi:hypothetical protein
MKALMPLLAHGIKTFIRAQSLRWVKMFNPQ